MKSSYTITAAAVVCCLLVTSSSATRQETKDAIVDGLLAAKEAANVTFNQIADAIGLLNVQTADIFYRQAKLPVSLKDKMQAIVPGLTTAQLNEMTKNPFRTVDPAILGEPHLYRMQEAIAENGRALVALVQEMFGDGIMSAINFYFTVSKLIGTEKEARVVITMNGKFLPHIAQYTSNNTMPKIVSAGGRKLKNMQEVKDKLVADLLAVKAKANVTFNSIAQTIGLTNVQTADIFFRQAMLPAGLKSKMQSALPGLSNAYLKEMMSIPFRTVDQEILTEPHIYRMREAVAENGQALVALVQEMFGDGIMSAINFYFTVEKLIGTEGEPRVVIVMNGKFLPHIAQFASNNTMPKIN